MRDRLLIALLFVLAFTAASAPAYAAAVPPSGRAFVVLTGALDVPKGSTVTSAVIFDGDASIEGATEGDVVAFNGDVTIGGSVSGNVTSLNGRVLVLPGAEVAGDVYSKLTPDVAKGTVAGTVNATTTPKVDFQLGLVTSRVAVWLATSVSAFLLGLLFILFSPKAADAGWLAAVRRVGPSIGFGALVFFVTPIAAILVMITLVGLPIGVGVLLALGLIYWLGYTAAAYAIGRLIVRPPAHRLLAFLLGWGILRLVALVPLVGGLTWLCATVWGLGALVVAARLAGRSSGPACVTGAGTAPNAPGVGGDPGLPAPPPMPPPY